MILMGIVVAIPAAIVGFQFARWTDRRMPIPMRPRPGVENEAPGAVALPPLVLGAAPVVMPVLLISMSTIVDALRTWDPSRAALWTSIRPFTSIIGNPNLALLLSAVVAMWLYARQRRPNRAEMSAMVETSLMGAGVVILIIAAGGAFGAMLQAAQLGPAIQRMFVDGSAAARDSPSCSWRSRSPSCSRSRRDRARSR